MAEREAFYQWQAQTSRLVPKISHGECIEDWIVTFVKEIKRHLKHWGPPENQDIFLDSNDNHTTLKDIVVSSIQLDRMLSQQKAVYFFSDWNLDKMSKDAFEVEGDGVTDEVQFSQLNQLGCMSLIVIKAPAFRKSGTSDGKDYDLVSILLPALVELDPRLHLGLHKQNPAPDNGNVNSPTRSEEGRGRIAEGDITN